MEITLAPTGGGGIDVGVDGAPPHRLDPAPSIPDEARRGRMFQDRPRQECTQLFDALFSIGSPARLELSALKDAPGPGPITLAALDPGAQAIPWEHLCDRWRRLARPQATPDAAKADEILADFRRHVGAARFQALCAEVAGGEALPEWLAGEGV